MLKNLWYAIEWSHAVTDEPLQAKVLGQKLVLYRDERRQVVAMSDICIHRGAELSGGWVDKGCIVCPYHAWSYGADGECVRIPAAGDGAPIPKKARIDAYPTHEKYGWVWVFMGDLPEAERPPIPDLGPEFDDPGTRAVTGEWLWDANYERVVENGVDATHVNWVHNFNDPERAELTDYEIEVDDWHGTGTYIMRPDPAAGLLRRLFGLPAKQGERPIVEVTTGWWLASVIKIQIRMSMGTLTIYDSNVPVDENTTRTLWIGMRDFFPQRVFDFDAKRRVLNIFQQDADIVERQSPELLPIDFAGELHHKTDSLAVAYRKRRHQLIDKGWGIDTHRIAGFGGKQVTVIPSPSRRESPDLAHAWVMKEVPVIGDMGADHGEAEYLASEPS